MQITNEYIRMTYGCHTRAYEWHKGWHTSTYEWHMNDIRLHTSNIRMICKSHMDDMRFGRKIKLTFLKLFDNIICDFQNMWFVKEFLVCNGCFGLFTKTKKGCEISFSFTFSACFFHSNAPYLTLYQLTKFQRHIFFTSQDIKQNLFLSSYLDNWWRHKL